jgi:colicin import membrane protein
VVDVESTPTFAKKFAITFVAHLGLLFLAAMVGKAVGTLWKTNDVEVIRSSVRVDIVGMPKFTIQELKEMEKSAVELPKEPEAVKAPDKVEAKPEAPDVINKDDLVIQEAAKEKEKKKTSFLNSLSDYAKKDVKKETKKGQKNGAADENIKALVLEGNRLSQGTALTGDYSDEATSEFGAYVQTIPGAVRPYWRLPDYLMKQDLRCRIRIFLKDNGTLITSQIVESSGNAEYDERALNAIKQTNFPKPSEAVAKRLSNSGIILGFPL